MDGRCLLVVPGEWARTTSSVGKLQMWWNFFGWLPLPLFSAPLPPYPTPQICRVLGLLADTTPYPTSCSTTQLNHTWASWSFVLLSLCSVILNFTSWKIITGNHANGRIRLYFFFYNMTNLPTHYEKDNEETREPSGISSWYRLE